MALYTQLTDQELAGALGAYGLPPPERAMPEPKGSVNTNYHLWSGGKRWFLRLNEGKSAADVAFEAQVLRFLEAETFPSARLVPARDGAPWVEVHGKPAMLFAFVAGDELERQDVTPAHCRALGAQLGRLHALAGRFAPARPNPYRWARVEGWVRGLEPDGGGDAQVRPWVPMLREELERSRQLPEAPRGLCHGDLFLDNVLWDGPALAALLDWEMSCVDAFAYDLAVCLHAWCYGTGYRADLVTALLEGYRRHRPVDAATADALYPYARYAALRYTASRIHAFHLAELGADRLAWKDWTRYRDRLVALREMGEVRFRALLGL
jgi:homoserine kinase type II